MYWGDFLVFCIFYGTGVVGVENTYWGAGLFSDVVVSSGFLINGFTLCWERVLTLGFSSSSAEARRSAKGISTMSEGGPPPGVPSSSRCFEVSGFTALTISLLR